MSAPPTRPSASGPRRRRRATCGSTRSSRRRRGPAPRRSIPATDSSPSGPSSPAPSRTRASRSSDPAARRSRRWATSSRRDAAPPRPACRSFPGRSSRRRSTGRQTSRRSSTRRSGSASRCWSRPRPAAVGGGCGGSSSAAELPAALAAGSAEARSAFGDGSVYLEREIRPARHVEVQLIGDADGRVVVARRAGLLAPAPPSEARRGVAGTRA